MYPHQPWTSHKGLYGPAGTQLIGEMGA